jgi:pimeloyl-ACP methyl ester carboxylesterase
MRAKRVHSTFAAGLVVILTAHAVAQQPKPAPPTKGVEEQNVRTADGWSLPITYFRSDQGKNAPVVILLHGKEGNRLVWRGLGERLQAAGYAAVAVDLRKHGDSQAPARAGARAERLLPSDYQKMVLLDLEAVKDFLHQEHQAERLNIRKTGIVALDDTAPVATNWAVLDWNKKPWPDAPPDAPAARTPKGQDVRAVALLSPSEGAGTLNLGRTLPFLKNDALGVAFYIAVGSEDRDDRDAAEKAYERLTSGGGNAKARVFLDKFDNVKSRGAELLGTRNLNMEGRILKFFDDHLKSLPDRWETRKSRLQ